MSIPFDEIVPGATVRFTNIDGVQYLSISDIIKHICAKDFRGASKVWRNLPEEKKAEVWQNGTHFKFSGQGQSEQPVITFKCALKLVMLLSGDKAAMHRVAMVSILSRYYAGDDSLTDEIEANAASSSAIAEMARNSVVDGAVSNKRPRVSMEFFANEVSTILKSMECELAGHLNIIAAGQGDAMMVLSQVDAKQDDICTKLYELDVQLKTEKEVNTINAMNIMRLNEELKEVADELRARQEKIKKQEYAISCLNTTIRAKDALLAKANSSAEVTNGKLDHLTALVQSLSALVKSLLERH